LESHSILEGLRKAGARVRAHKKYFKHDTPDTIWLKAVSQKGWIVLTKDKRILKRVLERLALFNANGRAFVLASGHLKGEVETRVYVAALPAMLWQVLNRPAPFLIKIHANGTLWLCDLVSSSGREKRVL
jgi:hypothetical protein